MLLLLGVRAGSAKKRLGVSGRGWVCQPVLCSERKAGQDESDPFVVKPFVAHCFAFNDVP